MKDFKDSFLQSLKKVYESNKDDQSFKKYFALELFKKGEFQEALPLLRELSISDSDLNLQKAIKEIESTIPVLHDTIGFTEQKNIEQIKDIKKEIVNFSDVAGMDHVKEAIRTDIIYPFQHPEVYKMYNKKAGGGILLFGPPGCGKTFIAKATAGEINAKFISLSIHELLSPFSGEGERALHDAFEWARENSPSVIFLDEIDAIGMSRTKTSGALRTLVNVFLTELDGIFTDNEGILVIGATNLPWEIDTALRRPGRFDRIIFVTPPDRKARAKLFELKLRGKPIENINYEKLADMTKQYSSADIERICDEASEKAFKKSILSGNIEKLSQVSLEEVASKTRSSITDWFSTVKNYIQYSNESGLYNNVKDYLDNIKND
ncbi:hypothetical protein A2W32_02820 [candidate division WWE3 bacterium RBG_16_37_10]|uniref:AAA+ ATPase domain-containing protein n=1 Tax=candidate division WWE3 bacterium RBG_16_37_10 TaxID=1802610 RepID=A0A1F4V3J5_UNCKA|nr:MAG: hypothetical protein A2W32_02820 [candidate division WWE3 bacterium RBG_16_37_10]